jgi:membrane protein DedA with SNARE-associated domain
LAHYGPWAVFVLVALESAGVPMPGETALVTAAVLAGHSHEGSIALIVAAAAGGAIFGDNIGFWIGREFGLRLLIRHGPRFGLDEDRLRLGQYLFARFGGAIVFFGRFVAVLRAFAAVLAGANKVEPWRFFLYNAAGGILWATIFGLGGYVLGAQFHRIAGPFGAACFVVAAGLIFLGWRHFRRNEQRLIEAARRALPGPLGFAASQGAEL